MPIEIIQKYINEWYTASLDLFGGEDSSNAATYFAASLKGRFQESDDKRWPDHLALEGVYEIDAPVGGGRMSKEEIPMRRAMNLVLRDSYAQDCERAVERWNKTLADAGIDFKLALPSQRFNRQVGIYANMPFDPVGNLLEPAEYDRRRDSFLPTKADLAYVKSLMVSCTKAGEFANWIAPPRRGINGQPLDFEYVKFMRN